MNIIYDIKILTFIENKMKPIKNIVVEKPHARFKGTQHKKIKAAAKIRLEMRHKHREK